MVYFESYSERETFAIAYLFGTEALPGEVYCLEGDLGAGKTVFAKGFAAGLKVKDLVDSPTFTILKSYSGRLELHHFDVYRVIDPDEFTEIGFEDFFYGDGVCLVEWPENVDIFIPSDAKWINIQSFPDKGQDFRLISYR